MSDIYEQPFRGKLEKQMVIAYLSLSSWDSALQITRFRRLLKKQSSFEGMEFLVYLMISKQQINTVF